MMKAGTCLSTMMIQPVSFDRCPECRKPMVVDFVPGEPVYDIPVLCDLCAARRVAAAATAENKAALRARYQELLRRGLVGEEMQACSWSNSSAEVMGLNPKAWRDGRAWHLLGEKNMYVWGSVGVGKTWLARAALRDCFVHGRSVAEVTARRLCKVSDTFREGDGLFSAWKSVSVLLIDDLDKAAWTLERVDALWELLDARSGERKRTIVCANLGPVKMLEVLKRACVHQGEENQSHGVAAMDRLKPVTKLEMVGASQR